LRIARGFANRVLQSPLLGLKIRHIAAGSWTFTLNTTCEAGRYREHVESRNIEA
jgi:hypothetical protein